MDSITNPRVKIAKEGIRVRSLAYNILGAKGVLEI
jgi:hypothetical protein